MPRDDNDSDHCLVSNLTCSDSSPFVQIYVLDAVIGMLIVCGNLLVIISICHFKQLHTPTNVLICSLAMSDLLVGLFELPFQRVTINSCTFFEPMFCSLVNAVTSILSFVSIYHISLIAMDRYLALGHPFIYSGKVSISLILIIVALLWIVSLILSIAFMYFNGRLSLKCPNICYFDVNEMWVTADLVLVFLLPCSSIIIFYLRIFFIAKKHIIAILHTQRDRNGTNSMNKWESTRAERKAGRALGLVVLVFFVCLIPHFICSLACELSPESHSISLAITMTIFYLNSAINPVIYALFYPWFKNSVRRILSLHICRAGSSSTNVLSRDS